MIFDDIRAACARVASEASHVHIVAPALESYASTLTADQLRVLEDDPAHKRLGSDEASAAYVISLDAINFGSGYFPALRKREGMSGYHTIATAWREAATSRSGVTDKWLADLTPGDCTEIFAQRGQGPLADELMAHFAAALRDLGQLVTSEFDGSFLAMVESAAHSAAAFVAILDRLAHFHDVHRYRGDDVPLYKRAQIAAFDVAFALDAKGPARFDDLDQLTMFADNLVPHVLRVDGVLEFAPELVSRIERVDDIASGSEPEIEIRAVAVHAVEQLRAHVAAQGEPLTSGQIDNILWNRGGSPRYKAIPRHRTRCVYY